MSSSRCRNVGHTLHKSGRAQNMSLKSWNSIGSIRAAIVAIATIIFGNADIVTVVRRSRILNIADLAVVTVAVGKTRSTKVGNEMKQNSRCVLCEIHISEGKPRTPLRVQSVLG